MQPKTLPAGELKAGMRIPVNAAWQNTRCGEVLSVTVEGESVVIEATDPHCRDSEAAGVPISERRITFRRFVNQHVTICE